MASYGDRLSFLSDWVSDTAFSEASGIPRSTLGFVRRGERELPSEYYGAFRSTYQSAFYSIMKDEGFPRQAALRYSYATPETYDMLTEELDEIIDHIAIGWAAAAVQRKAERGEAFDYLEELAIAREKAAIAVEESPMSWEDISEGRLS